jgi:hypothetical protein
MFARRTYHKLIRLIEKFPTERIPHKTIP